MNTESRWEIYKSNGQHIGRVKHVEDAAKLIALMECFSSVNGYTIRDGPTKIVWTEGTEEQSASCSHDFVASVVNERTKLKKK